jgi:hypothetical protein
LEEVLAEVGLAVGVEASAEVLAEASAEAGLAGAIPMPGDGLGMVCLMLILMEDTDLLTHIMVMAYHSLMATTHIRVLAG